MRIQGADLDAVADVELRLSAQIEQLGAIVAADHQFLASLRETWLGADSAEFDRAWQSVDRPAIDAVVTTLMIMRDELRANRLEQEQTSATLGSARADGSVHVTAVPPFTFASGGFHTDQSYGFVVESEYGSNNTMYQRSDGSMVTEVSAYSGTKVDFGDLKTLVDIATLPNSLASAAGAGIEIAFDAEASSGYHYTLEWDRESGSSGEASKVFKHFLDKQDDVGNLWFGGQFGIDDIHGSLRAEEVPPPTAVRESTTAVDAHISIGIGAAGPSGVEVGGIASMDGRAQSYETRYADGRTAIGTSYEAAGGAGITMDLPHNVGGIEGSAAVLKGGGVEIVFDQNGNARSIQVVEAVEVSASADGRILGYGETTTSSIVTERQLTFDLDDPAVRQVFGDEPDIGTVMEKYQMSRGLADEFILTNMEKSDSSGMSLLASEFSAGSHSSDNQNVKFRGSGEEFFQDVSWKR